jgi:ABC-type uncharacterized transport system ATPase subunit
MQSNQAVIKVSNLKKAYADVQAVNGVSFSVNRGEIFYVTGFKSQPLTDIVKYSNFEEQNEKYPRSY